MIYPLLHLWSFHIRFIFKSHFHVVTEHLKNSFYFCPNVKAYSKNRHSKDQIMQLYCTTISTYTGCALALEAYPSSSFGFICSRMFVSLFYFLSPVVPTDRTDTNELPSLLSACAYPTKQTELKSGCASRESPRANRRHILTTANRCSRPNRLSFRAMW